VFHQDIQTPRRGSKKGGAAEFFNNRLRGVWIPDETFLRVFKMASQTIHSPWRNSKKKFAKFYPKKLYPNHRPVVAISFVFSL